MRTKDSGLMNEILLYIDKYYSSNYNAPTMQEIADSLNTSKQVVSKYLKEMDSIGMLQKVKGSRGIRTKKMETNSNNFVQIPVLGSVSCGNLLFAEQNILFYIPLPEEFLGRGTFFGLYANGNSMIKAGINNGDLVLIRIQQTAENGQIALALVDDEATLKRFYRDEKNNQIRLHPENDEMQDMYFNNVEIQGVAVKVIKNLI